MKEQTLFKLKPVSKINDDFFVFDTETGIRNGNKIHYKLKGNPAGFIFGCIYGKVDGREYKRTIFSVDEFLQEFKKEIYTDKHVFAHNAEYDLNTIFQNIYVADPQAKFNGKFICMSNDNAIFADSLNIFQTSVAEIGKMIGVSKRKLGTKKTMRSDCDLLCHKYNDVKRCEYDCIIVWKALFKAFEKSGSIKLTLASLSLTFYRRFYQPYNFDVHKLNERFFESYYGGRTEIFVKGETTSYVIDRNSAYPFCMAYSKFPNVSKMFERTIELSEVDFLLNEYEGQLHCTIEHSDIYFGCLPYRDKGLLIFPTGTLTGTWTFPEIRNALKYGCKIIKTFNAVYSRPIESPFKGFVESQYKERFRTNDEFEIYMIKIFMNCLYGKFASRIEFEHEYFNDLSLSLPRYKELLQSGQLAELKIIDPIKNNGFFKKIVKKKQSCSIPSFAAYITAYQRIDLFEMLMKCKQENRKPTYCDTDSVAMEKINGIISGFNLGDWKIENKLITYITALKNYTVEKIMLDAEWEKIYGHKEEKIKGVPKRAVKLKESEWRFVKVTKTKEGIRRGITIGDTILIKKEISGDYSKRIVDGQETKPIIIKP